MTYLFDSNTFMEAARLYYSFELAPGFWEWLTSDRMKADIASVESVRDEISKGTGDLVNWSTTAPAGFWRPVAAVTVDAAAALSEWATDPARNFKQSAVDEFLSSCDYWLIAEGMATGLTVVTREVSAPESRKRIKIPDACKPFGVPCEQPFPVYQKLGLKLG